MIHLTGIIIAICSFLIIGLFHPIVIKTEYYTGTRYWWVFLVVGIIGCAAALLIADFLVSTAISLVAFCCFWSIKELYEQAERVRKGWFPKNPKRNYDN